MNKLKIKRIQMENKTKYWCMAAALIVMLAGGCLFYLAIQNKEEKKEYALYECGVMVDGGYSMELKKNNLYPEGVLGEGRLYARNLARNLHVSFRADFTGSEAAQITRQCQVDVVVQGYQDEEEGRNIIYEEVRRIKEIKPAESTGEAAGMTQEVQVELAPYEKYVQMAAKALGTNPMCELQIRFAGTFLARCEYGEVETPFSYIISMPLETDIFTVTKPDAIEKTEMIHETRSTAGVKNPLLAAMAAVIVILGAAALLLLQFYTSVPDAETKQKRYVLKLLRKYKSRMIIVKDMVDDALTDKRAVADIDSLVKLSDEIQRPICYCPDEHEMPVNQMLYTVDGKVCYYLIL